MELLIAFLIAFNVVSAEKSSQLTRSEAEQLVVSNNLSKEFIIWDAEGDDF